MTKSKDLGLHPKCGTYNKSIPKDKGETEAIIIMKMLNKNEG